MEGDIVNIPDRGKGYYFSSPMKQLSVNWEGKSGSGLDWYW